jgi:arabinoxylan arabinofuranohydrolase
MNHALGTASARRTWCRAALLSALSIFWSSASFADNPFVQTNYTADPAPLVYDGRLYVFTGHDEDVTVNNFFTMNEWRVYSTIDMVNWTDHGSPLSYKDFAWAKGDAWAGQCIFRNGKFYFYVPLTQKSGGTAIGVAVSTSPTGPFSDALGKPLVSTGSGDIDPTAFIDADGQAYLYWGNPNLWYVKLNADMISFPGSATKVNLTTQGFGTRKDTSRATAYEEGPWFYKRSDLYYMVFAANGIPEQISYATSSNATGPWSFRSVIMDAKGASFTNHSGVVDYQGSSYFFYHTGALPGGSGYHRSVSVERFTYKADGTIPTIGMTNAGPAAIAKLDPYTTTQAETIAWSSGLKTEPCSEGGVDVTSINNGDQLKVANVDFGSGALSFEARVAASGGGGSIELRVDSQTGTLIGTCAIASTGGAQTWTTKSCAVNGAAAVHDLYFRFVGGSGALFNFNWWKFTPREGTAGSGGAGGVAGSAAGGAAEAGSSAGGASGFGGVASGAGGSGVGVGGALSAGGTTSGDGVGGKAGSGVGSAGLSLAGAATAGGPGDGPPSAAQQNGCACRAGRQAPSAELSLMASFAMSLCLLRRKRRGGRGAART